MRQHDTTCVRESKSDLTELTHVTVLSWKLYPGARGKISQVFLVTAVVDGCRAEEDTEGLHNVPPLALHEKTCVAKKRI